MPAARLPHGFFSGETVDRRRVEENFRALEAVVNHMDAANLGTVPDTAVKPNAGYLYLEVDCTHHVQAVNKTRELDSTGADAPWSMAAGIAAGVSWTLVRMDAYVDALFLGGPQMYVMAYRDGVQIAGTNIDINAAGRSSSSGYAYTFTVGQTISLAGRTGANRAVGFKVILTFKVGFSA